MADHVNPNRASSQNIDVSASTSWAATKYWKGDGTWDNPLGILPAFQTQFLLQ